MDVTAGGRHRELWLSAEVAHLKTLMTQGIDPEEIALQLGRTKVAIQAKWRILNLKRNRRRRTGNGEQRRLGRASSFLS